MTAFSHGERRYLVLVNRGAGTVRSRGAGVVAKLVEEGLAGAKSLEVRLMDGAEILPAIREALEQDRADVIAVGGGDGTLSSAAGVMAGRPQTLAVLPLGTMNMVSQAAGFSRQLEVALREVAAGTARPVDVGRVNGRAFLHQVSFGIQPRVVRIREKIGYTSRATKILSGMVALFSVLSRPRPVRMVGGIDGQIVRLTLPALVVSNNLYRVDRPSIPVRLDGGVLGVYMITATRWRDYIRLMLVALRGTWKDDEMVNAVEAREVRLAPRRGKGRLLASIDGELTHLKAPVGITIEPRALNLITGPGLPVAGVS